MVAPEGWELVKLGDKANIFRGGSPRPIQAYLTTLSNGINWIKIGDVEPNAKFINVTNEKIIPAGVSRSREVQKGDFILSNSMSFGRPYILNIDGCIHDGWLVIQDYQNNFDQHYLYYALCSDATIIQYRSMAAGSSVQNLNKEKVSAIILPKPPLPEQHAIAEVLSDMDGYIASLEKLIAKKKTIKQGAMQELLTGKRRLPGFEGEWEIKQISELFILLAGGDLDVINYSAVKTTEYKYPIFSNSLHNQGLYGYTSIPRYKGDSITITGRGLTGVAIYRSEEFDAIIRLLVLTPNNNSITSSKFITYLINQNVEFPLESTGVPQLTVPQIQKIEMLIPPYAEQSAIAAVLSDMDAEIESLNAKLNKAEAIKQGMMQELLTGKIRLVKPKPVATPVTEVVEKNSHGYSEGYEDAVILVALVNSFGTEQHPFTAFDCQKFPYLFHRHIEGVAKGYKKFAAGPYNPSLKYRTARPIALGKKYIREYMGFYKGFITDENAGEALGYFEKWYGEEPLKWLEQFRYIKNRKNELELLTTVDKTMVELRNNKMPVAMSAVKEIIENSDEWKPKLKREIFSGENISRAIAWSIKLFGDEE
jgi:type I restriction enzyme S subunit